MDYQDILLNLAYLPLEYRRFTSRLVSQAFKAFAGTAMPFALSRRYPSTAFEVKSISGDLDRLYRMRLLKREIRKRQSKTKKGKSVIRGREYVYEISKQGWKYVGFLAENGPPSVRRAKANTSDTINTAIEMAVKENFLPHKALDAYGIISKYLFSNKKGSVRWRFPIRNYDWELFHLYLDTVATLCRQRNKANDLAKRALDLVVSYKEESIARSGE